MNAGEEAELCDSLLSGIRRYASARLPPLELLRLDEQSEGVLAAIDLNRELGVATAFLPAGAAAPGTSMGTKYRLAEELGRVDLGIATSLLATLLGLDPVVVGGTEEQRALWTTRVAEGWTLAYCATEPRGGSDLSRLETTATPVNDERGEGYVLRGRKQWITNAGIAQAWIVLARAPAGPSWFIVDGRRAGLSIDAPEDKHGIRLSNTAGIVLDDVYVPRAALVGEREGFGMTQAASVFGFTRVMVGAFALGSGWVALEAAIRHAQRRRVGGVRLCDLDGFTQKLLVPPAVALELARAQIEAAVAHHEASGRSEAFAVEGALAKYLASEAANFAAECALQALGGSGYARGYGVEKIRRDVRITKIYEGTSEVLEGIIGRDTWRSHLASANPGDDGGPSEGVEMEASATARRLLCVLCAAMGRRSLQRSGHCIMQLGATSAHVRGASAFARAGEPGRSPLPGPARDAAARIAARNAVTRTLDSYLRLVGGSADGESLPPAFEAAVRVQRGYHEDARVVASALVSAFGE